MDLLVHGKRDHGIELLQSSYINVDEATTSLPPQHTSPVLQRNHMYAQWKQRADLTNSVPQSTHQNSANLITPNSSLAAVSASRNTTQNEMNSFYNASRYSVLPDKDDQQMLAASRHNKQPPPGYNDALPNTNRLVSNGTETNSMQNNTYNKLVDIWCKFVSQPLFSDRLRHLASHNQLPSLSSSPNDSESANVQLVDTTVSAATSISSDINNNDAFVSSPLPFVNLKSIGTTKLPDKCFSTTLGEFVSNTVTTLIQSDNNKSDPVKTYLNGSDKNKENLEDGKVCKTCGKGFKFASNLEVHETSHENELGKFSCKICNELFSEVSTLLNHRFVAHNVELGKKFNAGDTTTEDDDNVFTIDKASEKLSSLSHDQLLSRSVISQLTGNGVSASRQIRSKNMDECLLFLKRRHSNEVYNKNSNNLSLPNGEISQSEFPTRKVDSPKRIKLEHSSPPNNSTLAQRAQGMRSSPPPLTLPTSSHPQFVQLVSHNLSPVGTIPSLIASNSMPRLASNSLPRNQISQGVNQLYNVSNIPRLLPAHKVIERSMSTPDTDSLPIDSSNFPLRRDSLPDFAPTSPGSMNASAGNAFPWLESRSGLIKQLRRSSNISSSGGSPPTANTGKQMCSQYGLDIKSKVCLFFFRN